MTIEIDINSLGGKSPRRDFTNRKLLLEGPNTHDPGNLKQGSSFALTPKLSMQKKLTMKPLGPISKKHTMNFSNRSNLEALSEEDSKDSVISDE